MSTPSSPTTAPTPMQRRIRYAARAAALLLAITATCVFVGVLTSRLHARIDVTATREHRLSERTRALLDRLDRPHEIVLAGNFRMLDPVSRQRSEDVLTALAEASKHLRITRIDTGSERGLAQYDAMLDRCVRQFEGPLEKVVTQVQGVVDSLASRAAEMGELAELLEHARTQGTAGDPAMQLLDDYLRTRAGMARTLAEDLRTTAEQAREALGRTVGRAPIPAVDEAARILRDPLVRTADDAAALHRDLSGSASSDRTPARLRDALRPIADAALLIRDQAARAVAVLETLRTPPILSAARALERSGGAVVMAEPRETDVDAASRARSRGLTAIDFDALFPAVGAGEDRAADQRVRAEELLGTALAALNNPDPPILVVVHGESVKIGPEFAYFRALRSRLALRGIDMVEWATALEPEAPVLTNLDPSGKRPVVYLGVPTGAGSPEGAVRMGKLAATLARLWNDGKPLLLTVNPSTLPTIGEKDPMVEFLAAAGVVVDTARPLLQQFRSPQSTIVTPDFLLPDPGGPQPAERHPIAGTITGLPTYFMWPLPIRSAPAPEGKAAATVTPLIVVQNEGRNVWAESEWLQFRQVPANQRSLVRNPPAPDSARDDTTGPWTIAAAVERRLPGAAAPHRTVIVASHAWFFDAIAATPGDRVDGRTPLLAPGNLELVEACVSWLAGQDELIAPSATARAVPLVPPIAPGNLLVVRWLLVLGLPALVLAVGVAWRFIRG
jgi:hypothetical protein